MPAQQQRGHDLGHDLGGRAPGALRLLPSTVVRRSDPENLPA
ncbi:hypothetical protein [Blastococcus sp. CT_GayMR20]|nr:hypothetical protein [Blastococcus sp. CT_GayMR20]